MSAAFRSGVAVLLRPRRGSTTPTCAEVTTHVSPSTVRVRITADSGGRQRGMIYTAPLGCLAPRQRGRHRRPALPDVRIRGWRGR